MSQKSIVLHGEYVVETFSCDVSHEVDGKVTDGVLTMAVLTDHFLKTQPDLSPDAARREVLFEISPHSHILRDYLWHKALDGALPGIVLIEDTHEGVMCLTLVTPGIRIDT